MSCDHTWSPTSERCTRCGVTAVELLRRKRVPHLPDKVETPPNFYNRRAEQAWADREIEEGLREFEEEEENA